MADLSNYLKQQYASQLESELAGLKEAYESQRNFAAATNALEKQAFDERANAMGLNTGTSGQAQLARSSAYQRELADLGAAELVAMAKAKADNATAMNNALYAEMLRQDELAAAQAAAADKAVGGDNTPQYTLGGSGKPSSDDRNVYGYTKYLKQQGASNSEIRKYINNEATGLTGAERRELASKYK